MNEQDRLEELYILVGSTIGPIEDYVLDEIRFLENLLNPPIFPLERLTELYKCNCGRRDCWECVYADDPEGI
jgi:hypothetical protein